LEGAAAPSWCGAVGALDLGIPEAGPRHGGLEIFDDDDAAGDAAKELPGPWVILPF